MYATDIIGIHVLSILKAMPECLFRITFSVKTVRMAADNAFLNTSYIHQCETYVLKSLRTFKFGRAPKMSFSLTKYQRSHKENNWKIIIHILAIGALFYKHLEQVNFCTVNMKRDHSSSVRNNNYNVFVFCSRARN